MMRMRTIPRTRPSTYNTVGNFFHLSFAMSWFGNIRTFHASALNLLAGSLAKCPDLPWEKVQRIVVHCPPLPDSSSSSVVLHDRVLSGVVALGLFAVESELAHHGDKVLHYLLQLLESLPRASWVQNTLASAKREGVIVEQFCYKLGLILSQIAATNPSHSSKIVKALLEILQWFCEQFIKNLSTKPEEVCYETVPAILGLARAMKGTAAYRAKAFREICGLEGEPEGGGGGEEMAFTFDASDIIKLKNVVLQVTGSQQLKHLTSTAGGLKEGAGLPYRSSLSQVLRCSLVTLLRDSVTSCTLPLDPGFCHQLVKVCESEMEGGVRELGSSASASSNERAFHVICILSAATDMLVWASRNDTEIDSTFHRLSSLLTVHTSRFNVLVSPLRATILEGISSLAAKSQTLIPAALNTYKDLLYSSLLARMYSDAVASGNMESVLTARPTSFQMLTSYRLTSVHVSRADAFACVQWTLGQVVCSTLKVACEGGREVMDGFLASLGNKLYTTDASDNFACRTAECIVMVLGHVASHMGSKFNVVATVTGMFGQRLFHPTSSLDGKLVGELARIAALTADPETMEEVVRLMSLSLGESSPNKENKYGHIYQPMMDSLTFLARYLGDGEQRRELLLRTLQQFIQQGIMAKKASDSAQSTHKATSSSFSLGLLLPIIAGLAEGLEPFTDPPKKVIVIFRDFWLYCVVMGFSESVGVFPAGWYRSVQAVARKSPLLLSMGAGQFLDKELELNRPLRIESIGQGDVQEARQSLLDGLDRSPELDRLVVRLSFSQCFYLISIHRLESLRLETSTKNFPLVFNYLEDKGLQGELWAAIEKIAHKLFDQFIEQMQAKTATEESAAELESLTQLLVFKFNHIRGRIKQLADKFISKVVDKFSHLLWSRRVVYTMLDLLHQLSLSLHTMEPDRRRSLVVTLPDLPHSVIVPENVTKREKTVSYFAQRVEQILELAMRWSPRETTSILLEYVRSVASSAHHSGVSLATAQINKYFDLNPHNKHVPPVVSENRPSCVKDHLSLLSSSLQRRTHHSGEVTGMMTAASIMAGVSPGNEGREKEETVAKLAAVFSSQLGDALRNGSDDQLVTSLYRCTALLLHSCPSPPSPLPQLHRSLLSTITQLPVKTFTNIAITTAVQCWQWLLTAAPAIEFPFMRELCAVWKWSVEERRGLFSRDHTPSLGDTGKKRESVQTRQHTLIIQFLSDRFGVIQSRSSAQVQLISEVLHTSLTLGVGPDSGQPQLMSRCPEAVCPRFKLLALGVQLLREKLLTNSVERTILREKIYNTVLDYFCYEPLWPVDDTVVVRETIATLIKFWVSVRDMKNTSIVSLSSSVLEISTAPIPRSSSSFWQLALSSQASPAQRGWINTLGSVRVSKGISSTLLSPHTSFHQPRTPPTASRRSSTVNKSKALLKRKSVILSLLRHEVERLTVWQNPSSLPDQSVPGEDEVHSWINPTQSERHWRSTIVMAYQASPHLAFHMINRFRSLEVVAKEVTRLVRSDPVPFHTIPGAAQLLARRDGLQQGAEPVATELYHLLYWRNISPASTLIFFCRPFSLHPITAQFASKAMQSFKPDDILLYIPQLVQALRYDKLGFAKSYILTAAKTSQLLAHQFLWNMEANTYVDGEMTQRDPEIGDLLVQLAGKIKAGMTGTALKFYEREFTFFRKVTNISGIIRPYPKGPQRNSECLKALKEVELLPGVYLPSNPDSVVVEIDHGSGTPMQSAAKAPFLARFKVVKCGTGEVEKMNTHDEEVLSSLSSQLSPRAVWQAAIFKVGDDVRQDMLALQIIQLFRDVFHSVGLSLYLVPYRVVATACGCGVIEVVPDSKSRDKIGKQTQVSLREYFRSVYGSEDSVAYQEARANFVRSMAAYSLVSYLLQIKDRHNGNIMVDKHGHIIHIDFGFLFESSPGGNLGFEPDLKLTEEMLDVMDGKKSDTYRWFLGLCVQGYLCLRAYQEQVVSLVSLMLDTGFPCFRRNSIEELRARFRPSLSEREAAKTIIEVVEYSCLNFRTKTYDLIQDVQQNIYYHKEN